MSMNQPPVNGPAPDRVRAPHVFTPPSDAPECLLCGSGRTTRLEGLQSSIVTYRRCTSCGFVWVTNPETGESHAVTVMPERASSA